MQEKGYQLPGSPIVYYKECVCEGDWVLFLHAAFVHHHMFDHQIAYLRDHYRILTLDIIGHGASAKGKRGDDLTDMAGWIKDILDHERIDRIHVVGVSLGAVLAQDFANHHPHRMRSLACFGGYDIHRFDPRLQKENGREQIKMMMRAMVSIRWFAKANRHICAYTLQAQQEFYEMNIHFKKRSFRYLASLSHMVNQVLPYERSYPLLIGCGEHDAPMALEALKQWKQNEDNAYMAIIPHAGHCVNMDAPQVFCAWMVRFWNGMGNEKEE